MTQEIQDAVIKEYLKDYQDVKITNYFKTSDGYFIVVKTKIGKSWTEGEICFCSDENKVYIFSTAEELLKEFERRITGKWGYLLLNKIGLSFLVIILTLLTLCVLVFIPTNPNNQIIELLGGALLGAVGFLFGSSKT